VGGGGYLTNNPAHHPEGARVNIIRIKKGTDKAAGRDGRKCAHSFSQDEERKLRKKEKSKEGGKQNCGQAHLILKKGQIPPKETGGTVTGIARKDDFSKEGV